MPPKKKAPVATPEPTGHETGVDVYKSTMLNTTFYEPYCSCRLWMPPRYLSQEQAEAAAKKHVKESQ